MSSIPPPGWSPPAGARVAAPAAAIPSPALHLPAPSAQVRAAIWPRIAAFIADQTLAGLLAGLTLGLLGVASVSGVGIVAAFIGGWALVRVAGPLVAGESPGKLVLRLRTLEMGTAQPLTLGRLALREIVLWLVYWIPFVALLDAAKTERRDDDRSWRDRKADTVVVQHRPVSNGRVLAVVAIAVAVFVVGAGLPETRGPSSADPGQVAARWTVWRADAVTSCVSTGRAQASCECVLDEAARDVGPAAMLAGGGVAREAVIRAGQSCRSRMGV